MRNMRRKINVAYYCNNESGAGYLHSKHIANALSKIFRVKFLTKPKGLGEFLRQRKVIKNAAIFHERFCINPLPVFLRLGSNAKYILEMNDPGFETWHGLRKIIYWPFIKLKLLLCDAIVTQTETLKRIIAKHTDKPIFILPNAADPILIKAVQKEVKKIRAKYKGRKIVSFVSSFQPWHGTIETIEIIAKKKFENVVFLFIGEGPLYKEAKQLVKDKKLGDKIKLLGRMKQRKVFAYLKASDVCIAPFTLNFAPLAKYGFWWNPLKLSEYLAANKPIVSFDFYEVRKIVGNAALLAKPNDYNEFVKKLVRALNNGKTREKLSKEAKKIAKKNTWQERAKTLARFYEELLRG